MSISLLVTILVISALSVFVIGYVFVHRGRIASMTGMMIAMILGMLTGLTSGIIIGVLLASNLFLSTILGMIAGLVTGFTAGVPVSVMAVLDGMTAGLMGGMMGAMLGEMIPLEYKDTMIKFMFVVFVGMVLILLYMAKQELSKGKENGWFHHPFVMAMAVGLFFFGYNQLGPAVSFSGNIHDEKFHLPQRISNQKVKMKSDPLHGSHDHHTSDTPTKDQGLRRITIEATEFKFTPDTVYLKRGERVTILLRNKGSIEHDLELEELKTGEGRNVHLHAAPGETKTVSILFQETGEYQLICALPGHKEAGMRGIIKVQ